MTDNKYLVGAYERLSKEDDKKDEKEIKLNLIHYEDDVDENEKQEPKTTKRKTVSKNKAINGESVDPFSGQTVEL